MQEDEPIEVDDRTWRFEVRCRDRSGAEHVVGWTDDPCGGALVRLARCDADVCAVMIADTPPGLFDAPAVADGERAGDRPTHNGQ